MPSDFDFYRLYSYFIGSGFLVDFTEAPLSTLIYSPFAYQPIAYNLPTKIRKLQVTIETLENVDNPKDIAEIKSLWSVIALSGTTFSYSIQAELDEESAASELIPGRIGSATDTYDPG